MPHLYSRALTGTAVVVVLGLFLKLILTPDPVGDFFLQAGRLEASGATGRALQSYELIVARHPNSSYAPRALLRIGDLLAAQGRQSGNKALLRRSVETYVKLARSYPRDTFALTALQNAGTVAYQDLSDRPLARGIYAQIIRDNGQDTEIGAAAVVKMARLSIQDGDGERAKNLLQEVLRRWNKNVPIGSEAQYFLGFCYETILGKKDWAERAYEQVIAAYPTSQWANDARERLGLLIWKGPRNIRRVMLNIQPLPDELEVEGNNNDAMWNALRVALAARGLSGDTTLLQGYSLAPFYAGLNLNNAGEVINLKSDVWSNVVAAAGFRYSFKSGGREDEAFRDLQDEVDAGHLPIVFWQNDGKPNWSLVVGYDSERAEVMLQNRGSQFDTLAVKAWAPKWKVASPFGKSYTILTLVVPGISANPVLTPTPAPTANPGQTPAPLVNGPPAFVWGFAPIKENVPIGRTSERAANLLLRNGIPDRLLNANALDFLASTLGVAAREANAPDTAQLDPTPLPEPTGTSEAEGGVDNSIYDPLPTTTPIQDEAQSTSTSPNQVERARKLWAFWNAPATNWIAKRRSAAAWCRLAALKTNNARFNQAAELFSSSAQSLETAQNEARALDVATLGDHPVALTNMANECRKARNAERQAAAILG